MIDTNTKTIEQQWESILYNIIEERAQIEARTNARIDKLEKDGYRFYTLDEIRKMTPAEIDANWDRVQLSLKFLSR